MRQEVPDRQNTGGPSQSCSSQPEAFLLQVVRLQGRTEGFADRPQPLGARGQQALCLRDLWLQNYIAINFKCSQKNGKTLIPKVGISFTEF